jgi:hypothetical protein
VTTKTVAGGTSSSGRSHLHRLLRTRDSFSRAFLSGQGSTLLIAIAETT